MKTPIILIAASLLAIASCNKNMPVPDTGSDQTFSPDISYDPSDPSDPGQDPPSDPGDYSGDYGDPGNYSGDDGDDSGDDGGDDSGDDGNKYKGHVHHAAAPKTVTASKPSGSH
jgi:hypothetical protein